MAWFSIFYPNKPDSWFDFDYYRARHVPLAGELLGANMEIRRGIPSPDGSPPPFVCLGRIWVDSPEKFLARIAPHMDQLNEDMRKYTNIEPIVQFDEMIE